MKLAGDGMVNICRSVALALIAATALFAWQSDAAEFQQAATAPLYGRNYAVVAPIFTGADGNMSFLRLSNDAAETSTFIVTVVGSPSGKIYGAANIDVPGTSSPQYSVADVLSRANAAALAGGDTAYTFYLQDADPVGFQHVIFNGASGFFENASVCQYDMAAANLPIIRNVHTSRIAAYPAQISLHNYYNSSVTYQIQVLDSATGEVIGNVPYQTAANSTYLIPESYFEQQLGWTPNSSQQHISLIFTAPGIAHAPAVVSDFIVNQKLGAYVNMSLTCSVNDNAGVCIRDPNGLSHGCVKGSNLIGGTFGNSSYILTVSAAGNGQVDISPQAVSCTYGTTCLVAVDPGATVQLDGDARRRRDFPWLERSMHGH
jgi:hypothetical protein